MDFLFSDTLATSHCRSLGVARTLPNYSTASGWSTLDNVMVGTHRQHRARLAGELLRTPRLYNARRAAREITVWASWKK